MLRADELNGMTIAFITKKFSYGRGGLMSGITDLVQQQLTGGALQQISNQLGLDPAMTQMAVTAALPVVLGGMARHAANPAAAAAIHEEADNHAIPADMTTSGGAASAQSGTGGLLGKIFGANQQAVHDGVSQASGLNVQKAAGLVAMLAPFVLSAISRKKQEDGLEPTQVAGSLAQAQQSAHAEAQRQSPQLGGILGSIMGRVMQS
jgi:hypothetical protein